MYLIHCIIVFVFASLLLIILCEMLTCFKSIDFETYTKWKEYITITLFHNFIIWSTLWNMLTISYIPSYVHSPMISIFDYSKLISSLNIAFLGSTMRYIAKLHHVFFPHNSTFPRGQLIYWILHLSLAQETLDL